jgi:protein ImuA
MDLASLPRAAALGLAGGRAARWHPQDPPPCFAEIFAEGDDPGGIGACLALVAEALRQTDAGEVERRPLLWVQEERAIKLAGRPFAPGLPPGLRHRVIHVAAKTPQDALFALEEGLRCRDFACVIGEVAGNPKQLDFTASRRLALAAEKHANRLFLLRHDARADLSAARMRWRMRSAPSAPPLWNRAAPGRPAWHAELFRARAHPPGEWTLRDDGSSLAAEPAASSPDHGDLVLVAGA